MTRLIFCLLALAVLGVKPLLACDNTLKSEPMTLADATAQLNQLLFNTNSEQFRDAIEQWPETKCYLDSQVQFFPSANKVLNVLEPLTEEYTQIQTQAQEQNQQQRRALTNKINSRIARDAGSGFVLFGDTDGQRTEISLFGDLLDAYCSETNSQACADASDLAQQLWLIAGDYRALANSLNTQDKAESLVYLDKIDRQWRSYKDDTILLWPQEVLLNSVVYSPASQGLSSPPNYKLLALRPALGLSYLSDQSHRVQPTVNVDLLGIYWWKYGNKDANFKAQPGRGISATMIWDGDDLAYGLSYHHNPKWSMTLAHGDDNDVVVSISFQLAHWLVK